MRETILAAEEMNLIKPIMNGFVISIKDFLANSIKVMYPKWHIIKNIVSWQDGDGLHKAKEKYSTIW